MADQTVAENIVTYVVGLPSLGVLIAYGLSIIRRRASADSKAINEDKSYQSMLDSYRSERDEMKAERERILARMTIIETERNDAVAQVGKLTAEVEFLSSQVSELKSLVQKLGNSLDLARNEMHKFAVENAKLVAHVTYLEDTVKHQRGETTPPVKFTPSTGEPQ